MPPQTTVPPALGYRSEGRRNQFAGWGKDDRGIQLFRRRGIGRTRPDSAQVTGKLLGLCVAGPSDGKDSASLMAGRLSNDVGGGTEPVDAQSRRVSGHYQGAVTD